MKKLSLSQKLMEFPSYYSQFAEHTSQCKKEDVEFLQRSVKEKSMLARIYQTNQDFVLKLYNWDKIIVLSDIVPILTNLGLITISEDTFKVGANYMHRYLLELENGISANLADPEVQEYIIKIIKNVLSGLYENKPLNRISYLGKIDIKYVNLLSAYVAYAKQIKFSVDTIAMFNVLQQNYNLSIFLVDLFAFRFNTEINEKNRSRQVKLVKEKINTFLAGNKNPLVEKVTNILLKLIEATVRTNFYVPGVKSFLSLKIKVEKLNLGIRPVPHAEIFVFSNDFEAVHIRNSAVARGGMRWSDRADDYRTEVFGLAKTQLEKNSIIVPSGSKGGFYIKKLLYNKDFVVECYKNFIRGMLDITDNIVTGKTLPPPNVIIYDENDPYLVVAADKGTSTFSDFANQLSSEYNFWLQDAFASGGSHGYDHKKLGITARGAWESIKRHLSELGINIEKDIITVTGIGGMMGDVFGNGLLYSENIKLIFAINQDHIFIDPKPDAKKSFKERKRMFKELNGWDKYSKELISKGGGVYLRNDLNIKLSTEALTLLEITDEKHKKSLSGEELIQYVLKAEVDLLFNGGIGTFIKSENESNGDVNDKFNDNIRVNGNEVGAKVIGEGGNLGMTQLGRIEYCLAGGKCYTDAIDNSAGVSCSDHEVNLKIALNSAVAEKKITLSERNKILETMQEEVSEFVLIDNKLQTRIVSVMENFDTGTKALKYINLIKTFEDNKLLSRKSQSLPVAEEIINRSIAGKGLTKPEISVLLSYSKIDLKERILSTNLADCKWLNCYFSEYFPSLMLKKFDKYVQNHPLKKNIFATCLANDFINLLGPSTFIDIQNIVPNATIEDILKAFVMIKKIFNIDQIIEEIENCAISLHVKYNAFYMVLSIVKKNICNLISCLQSNIKDDKITDKFIKIAKDLHVKMFSDKSTIGYQSIHSQEAYINDHLPEHLMAQLKAINKLRGVIPISSIAVLTNKPALEIKEIYQGLDKAMNLSEIKYVLLEAKIKNYWSWIASIKLFKMITILHINLVIELLGNKNSLEHFTKKCFESLASHDNLLKKLKNEEADILAISTLVLDSITMIKKELESK